MVFKLSLSNFYSVEDTFTVDFEVVCISAVATKYLPANLTERLWQNLMTQSNKCQTLFNLRYKRF